MPKGEWSVLRPAIPPPPRESHLMPLSGLELRAWRSDRWLSQADLADLLGVVGLTVLRWENGTRTPPAFLRLALERLDELEHWGPPVSGQSTAG